MRRFRFRLASLLKLLARREESARAQVLAADARHRRSEALLEHLRSLHQRTHGERRRRRQGGLLPPSEEHLYLEYFHHMHRAIQSQDAARAQAHDELDHSKEALRHAATRHKIVDLLPDQRRAAFARDELRRLTRTLDDAATRQFLRARPHGPRPSDR